MSFIKKAVKKVWNFVKKHWKEIVMVAAIVFTAGIATVGMAGFQAAMAAGGGGIGGFFSAVGSTMWAGVTATAGSMGIGSGAAVGAGTPFAAAGIGGGAAHVGLGAAMGAGGGFGLGAAGKAASAAAMSSAAEQAAVAGMIPAGGIGVEGTGIGVGSAAYEAGAGAAATVPSAGAGLMPGATGAASTAGGVTGVGTAAESMMPGHVVGTTPGGLPGAVAAKEGGMSVGKAMALSTGVQAVGAAYQGYAEGKAMEEELKSRIPKAAWGVATEAGGDRQNAVEDYLFEGAVMQPLAGADADATNKANELTMAQARRPQLAIATPMSQSRVGKPAGPEDFQGVAYNPQQMLNSPGVSQPNALMAQDPRRQATRNSMGFSLMPSLEQWRLGTYGSWG